MKMVYVIMVNADTYLAADYDWGYTKDISEAHCFDTAEEAQEWCGDGDKIVAVRIDRVKKTHKGD